PRKGLRKVGSIGKACPGQEVLIVDEEGRELPPGQTGEIVIRGDVVMMGYFNKPQETAEALAGGVLHTGDVGYKDADGYIFIVDRLKDMIIRGGENIYPKEIDNLLVEHPKVRDAACVGVPDPLLGEELKAYVIARAGESLTEEEVRAYCTQRLASYKVPRYVQILEQDFPRNAVGKVLKQEMKRWGVAGPAAPPAAAAVGAEAAPAAPTAARAAPKGPEPGPAAGRGGEVTVADIFATMPARVDPKGVAGLEASFGYRITGEGGGEWTVVASGGKVKILPGIGQPDVVATISAPDWIDLTLGKLDGMTAFTSGKLRAEGQMMLLTKAAKMFKKYAPPAAVIPAAEEQREELVILRQLLSIPQRFSTGPTMGRFLTELRDGKRITGNRCPCCGRIQVPPREVCAVCRVRVEQFLEVGPEGALATWDIAYYASPDPLSGESRETPYCSAFILLDGCRGNDVFWHEIDPADIGRLKKGARVRPIWAERRTGAITDIRFFRIIG
ncbi:MAG: AMP-binding protein, partial [Deltaproteobacteria bacterium]|nr:AMP-binding protein [Deltaproteobacteria bacterium]